MMGEPRRRLTLRLLIPSSLHPFIASSFLLALCAHLAARGDVVEYVDRAIVGVSPPPWTSL